MKNFICGILNDIENIFLYENIFKKILANLADITNNSNILLYIKDYNVQGLKPFVGIGKYNDISHYRELLILDTENEQEFIPIIFSDSIIGGLKIDGYSKFEKSNLSDIFLSITLLLNSFIMYRETSAKVNRLSTLYEIAKFTNYLVNPSNAIYSLIDIVKSIVKYDSCGIYIVDNNRLNLKYFLGLTPDVILDKSSEEVNNALTYRKSFLGHSGQFKSFMIIPLVTSERVIGLITVGSLSSYEYNNDDIVALSIVSSQMSSLDTIFNSLISVKSLTTNIVDSINQGIITIDFDKRINTVNSFAKKFFTELKKYESSSLNKVFEKNHPIVVLLENTMEKGIIYENERLKINDKDVEANSFVLRNEEHYIVGVGVYFRDITEIIKLEERLKFKDRILTIGELAASIAHEIKNPLSGIKMVTQLLHNEINQKNGDNEPNKYTDIILEEVERLDRLINELLNFGKSSSVVFETLNVRSIIESILFLLAKDIEKSNIIVQIYMDENLPIFNGDRTQIKQVFMNLLKNAVSALGKVQNRERIITIKVNFDSEINCFIFRVIDNGVGISEQNRKKLFELFFTTNTDGTGLGLPIVQKIVKTHNGEIFVNSQENEYTEILIKIPFSGVR